MSDYEEDGDDDSLVFSTLPLLNLQTGNFISTKALKDNILTSF